MKTNFIKTILLCVALGNFAVGADLENMEKAREGVKTKIQDLEGANPEFAVIGGYNDGFSSIQSGLFIPRKDMNQAYGGWKKYMSLDPMDRPNPPKNDKLACFFSFPLTEDQDREASSDVTAFAKRFLDGKINQLKEELTKI